jgi:hypothetical protein
MREVTACAPVAQAAMHPKATVKVIVKHVLHVVRKPIRYAHRELVRTLRRHAYLAPKVAAHAKAATVCTVIALGGGLGAGIAAGGGVPPVFVPASHIGSAPPVHPRVTTIQGDPVQVPEPSSLLLLGGAAASLAGVRRRARMG